MSVALKEKRELANIANTAAAAARKINAAPAKRESKVVSRVAARNTNGGSTGQTFIVNPHGDQHAASIFLGSKPADVPSALAHGMAVHHSIPDEPTGAVRNPKRDHDATDIVTTIESAFNVVPDSAGALELDFYPTLHYPLRPTKGSVFAGGSYVVTDGKAGFGNETEADKFEELVSGVCCEALEVTISYVGNIEGISGELSAAAFAAGSSELMTGIPRPSDLQTMMSYPGAKSCEATQSLHMNLPHTEFTTGFFAGTSGLVDIAGDPTKAPYDDGVHNWSGCEHRPEKMTAPQGSAPFAPAEGAIFLPGGGNNNQQVDPTLVLNSPQYTTSYSTTDSVFPPQKFDVLPLLRVVGGNLTTGTNGSWLIKMKALYTGTALTHVGEMYHGASANISNSITSNAPVDSAFSKTSAILKKVGAGAATSDVTTASKTATLASDIASGAKKVGSFLWNTLGGWSGISSKLSSAAGLAAGLL